MEFEPAVPLEGKVEIYMQTVLDAMKTTLFLNLKRSLIRYKVSQSVGWEYPYLFMSIDRSYTYLPSLEMLFLFGGCWLAT